MTSLRCLLGWHRRGPDLGRYLGMTLGRRSLLGLPQRGKWFLHEFRCVRCGRAFRRWT